MADDFDPELENRAAWRGAFDLARQAQAAGLVVVLMAPINRPYCRHRAYQVSLWSPDGAIWAEASHEDHDEVLRIISQYRDAAGLVKAFTSDRQGDSG